MRLAAGGGVERRFIKDNFPARAVGSAGDYRGVEFAEERVVVVEPVRQVSSLSIQGENNIEAVTAIGTSAAKQVAEKGFQPFPQGLKPTASQALIVGAKAPTP